MTYILVFSSRVSSVKFIPVQENKDSTPPRAHKENVSNSGKFLSAFWLPSFYTFITIISSHTDVSIGKRKANNERNKISLHLMYDDLFCHSPDCRPRFLPLLNNFLPYRFAP